MSSPSRDLPVPDPRANGASAAATAPTAGAQPIDPVGTPPRPVARRNRPTRAELALLQSTIDTIDALVVIAHPECSLWMWNSRCEETSGIPLTQVAGQPLWSVMRLRKSYREKAQEAFDALISGKLRSVEFQAQWLRKDGRKARTRWVARLVSDGDEPVYIVATGTEATAGARITRALTETEDRFEKLLTLLPDPVVVHQDGKVVFANRAAAQMYGYRDSADFAGASVLERVAPESRSLVTGRMRTMLDDWADVPLIEERHVRKDGTPFEVEVIAAPVVFNGKPGVEVVVRDVSTRNEMVSALRESEARVRAVFDHSALGMLLVDREARIVESNAAFQRLLGYSQEQLEAMPVWDYTHPGDLAQSTSLLEDLFGCRNDGYELEKRYIAADGRTIWVKAHCAPICDEAGKPRLLVAMIEDIGQHKQLEEQLRQTSKMEALGRLASGVAHDFNNLLTIVNGYSDLLAAELVGEQREDAIKIKEAGEKAKELTRQLLHFGRPGTLSLQPVELNARLEQLAPMLRRLVGEDIGISVQLDGRVRNVQTEPSQLDQVIMNLAANARDAMPGGGKLSLSTRLIDNVPGRDPSGSWARIEMVDSGVGMEAEVLEHLFEPFYTTKGKEGTGLGLAIVYMNVQQMGGYVGVESQPGQGSRFIIDLPHVEAGTEAAAGRAPGGRPEKRTANILLVEDEPMVREWCRRTLQAEGFTVTACGPEEALPQAERLGRSMDLLITDVVMPELDGPTIAAALRSRRQDLPILFMTGYPRNREEELTGAAARGEVLDKPFTTAQLIEAIGRVLQRKG